MLQRVNPSSPTIQHVPLAKLVLDVTTRNPGTKPNETFTYVDLSAVDQAQKAITGARVLVGSEAPSRARQVICADDVLVSTVRPNLNGVALVPEDYDGAIASTGFCVLRPNRKHLDPVFLFHWVQSPAFVAEMVRKATGASYPAVSDRIVQQSLIPLPPLCEQRRIAAILDQADALRAKRREALAKLDEMAQAIFVEMFGDPGMNPNGYPVGTLSDLGTLDRGVSKHRPRNAPELLGGPYPFVQTGDVARSNGYIREYKATYSELGFRQSKLWPAGTLCITIAANIARVAILTFDACFPDSIVGFLPADPDALEFVRVWFRFVQKTLEESAPESTQKNINLAILRDFPIPIPSLELRRMFSSRIRVLRELHHQTEWNHSLSDTLFTSLQHRAFSGTL